MKNTLYIYSLLTLTFLAHTHQADAVIMKGDNMKLETELFNTFTKDKIIVEGVDENTTPQTQDNTSQQTPSPQKPQLTTQSTSINLSLNPNQIDFGTLAAGEPVQRSIQISATSPQAFTLHIAEDKQLTSDDQTKIPDTSCDSGSCTPGLAAPWTSPLVYGFGYTCTANIPCTDFPQNSFKPLANLSDNMTPQQFIASPGEAIDAELTFKVNIPPTNAGRTYSNTITIYSLPNY